MTATVALPAREAAGWFGQPRGLTILFLTEMWDQFSFYGMRALLVLYMTKRLMLSQQNASWIYGGYAAMVYLMPVFGGVVADRWLGRRRAVLLGGAIMAVGHFMMAFEPLLIPALATISIGNGLFLPSLPSQIDALYERDDVRRRSAYNVYYVGINLGAFAAPIVIGTVGELFGFHFGFAIAGVGMIVSLLTYIAGSRFLPPDARPAALGGAASAPLASRMREPALRRRLALLSSIAAVMIVFRGAYEQLGNTVSLWADGQLDRTVTASFTIPVTWFQALNPLLVFALTPWLVRRWTRQAARGDESTTGAKMASGAVLVGLAFFAIAVAAFHAHANDTSPRWPWLVAFIAILTAGELHILPVGLGLFGRLAPAGLGATTLALWYSAGFLGNLLAGWIGTLWTALSPGTFFTINGAVAGVSAIGLAMLAARVERLEKQSSNPMSGTTP